MKRILIFVFILPAMLNSQPTFDCQRDSIYRLIENAAAQDSFANYYKYIKEIESKIIQFYFKNSLYNASQLYINILSKTNEDSITYRRACTYHANNIQRELNDNNEALRWYLRAHAHSSDINTDDIVWYIEKRIGDIYSRKNDYAQAIYYHKLCIPSLLKHEDYAKMSRLYADLGDDYLWINKITEMRTCYDKAIEYGKLWNNIKKEKEYRGLYAANTNYASYYLNDINKEDKYSLYEKHILEAKQYLKLLNGERDYLVRKYEIEILEGDYEKIKGNYNKALSKYLDGKNTAELDYKSVKSKILYKI